MRPFGPGAGGLILYLYGFTRGDQAAPPASLKGVAGAEVALQPLGRLSAVVSRVASADFSAPVVEERMHDLEWLGEQGALHERVVTWFVDHGEILPARLLTLYSGPEALRDAVEPRTAALTAQLERLRDRREWDLKVSYDPAVVAEHLGEISERVAEMDRERAEASPGRGYLLERKRRKLIREETARGARRLAGEALEAVRRRAEDVRTLPLQRPSESDAEGGLVLNAALLVERAREEEARSVAEEERVRLGALGLTVELTGPWAPYRFLAPAGDEGEPDGAEVAP